MYDEKHMLTRAGAEQVIREGGSVLVAGRIVTRIEDLPSEADFARGDPAREAEARRRLEQQRDDAQRQIEALNQPQETAPAKPPAAPQTSFAAAGAARGRRPH